MAGGGLSLVSRVAIRTYLSVSDGAAPVTPPAFSVGALRAERRPDGSLEVLATVRNTGGRALDLSGSLRLSDGPGGLAAGPYPTAGVRTLRVGGIGDVQVKLPPQVPAGPWRARVDLQSGTVTRSVTATLTFPAAAGVAGPAVTAHPVPLARDRHVLLLVVAAALLLLLLLLLLRRLRPRRAADGATIPPREVVRSG